ncbi:MAG TPA: CPBP family intramembrane glutamic endopeptidase [Flavitalea sp.]|nr:CPBP family intramembrane glutamic endopeptidase [Flavitalea sp.]
MTTINQLMLISSFSALFFLVSTLLSERNTKDSSGTQMLGIQNLRHVAGMVLFGTPFIRLLEASFPAYPVSSGSYLSHCVFSGVAVLSVWIAYKSADLKKREWRAAYNDITGSQVAIYISLRIPFLILYECFFRGTLLAISIPLLGIHWAIAINIILYVLFHYSSSIQEMVACIPFGLVLCLLTIWWQSVFPAILLHLILSLVHESILFKPWIVSTKTPTS